MDICSCFRSASKSSVVSSSSDSEDGNESEIAVQPNPPKKHCSSATSNHLPSQDLESGDTTKSGKKLFPGWSLMKIYRVHSANYAKRVEDLFRGLVGLGLPNHSLNGRRWLRKWNHIQKSEVHLLSRQLDIEADRARKEGSIISQLQNVGEQQRLQNMKAMKALIRCTHFLAHQHIAHASNFDKLVELVVSCGGETLQTFLDRAGGNATYTSKMAVVEFVNALGTLVEESLVKKAPFLAFLASWLMNMLLP